LLAFISGEFQNLQIHLVGNLHAVMPREQIISESKVAAGEHLFAVTVVGKRARFAHQRVNHVAIVNTRGLLANESLHRLKGLSLICHRDCLGADSHIDFASDQATGNRVSVGSNIDRRALTDTNPFELVVGVKSNVGKPTKGQSIFGKPLLASRIGASDDLLHEGHVFITTGEVTTSTKHERLVDAFLEVTVLRFDVAVLVGTSRIGPLRRATVVIHQCRVASRQCRSIRVIAYGRAERITSVLCGHATELPKGVLNSFTECFERFGETERDGFDIAVSQHAVKKRVLESCSGDPHPEFVADGEVTGGEAARVMVLRKEHRFVRSVNRSPIGDTTLEGAPGRFIKLARMLALEITKKRDGLQSRLGLEQLLDIVPNFGKGIDASSVLAWQFSM